ncbi:hypothetical protein AYO41_01630 [Verrucomicrobia bacterium SCGC AG-212-E04]|nr:hypothetical protein AYO41_01630 [Verrucomicrobia bacterium SCGC AG-212-E04]
MNSLAMPPTAPVVLIIFNRPHETRRVFEAIRQVSPKRLLVAADGPRKGISGDVERCNEARRATENIDWPCEVGRRYLDENLGCRRAVSSAITWVFEQVDEAIILEDDCLPDSTFFRFTTELLEHYRMDERVGMISGNNFVPLEKSPSKGMNYYFSRHCHIWGWATWRRAWWHFDLEMKDWPAMRKKRRWLEALTGSSVAANFWRRAFDDAFEGHPDGLNTWDGAWTYACWLHGMLSVVPARNLVQNIGFGGEGTHTNSSDAVTNVPAASLEFPLTHPSLVEAAVAADELEEQTVFYGYTALQRLIWTMRLPLSLRSMLRIQRAARRLLRR